MNPRRDDPAPRPADEPPDGPLGGATSDNPKGDAVSDAIGLADDGTNLGHGTGMLRTGGPDADEASGGTTPQKVAKRERPE